MEPRKRRKIRKKDWVMLLLWVGVGFLTTYEHRWARIWGRGGFGWNHGKDGRHGRKTGGRGWVAVGFLTTDEHRATQFGVASDHGSGLVWGQQAAVGLDTPSIPASYPMKSHWSVDASVFSEMTCDSPQ